VKNRADIVQTFKTFIIPGNAAEARLLRVQSGRYGSAVVAGFFDNATTFVESILHHASQAQGVYFTPNELTPGLLARAANRLIERAEQGLLTKDHEVLRRRWLLVDLDAIRPAGIPSTDEEHGLALAKAKAIRDWLTSQSWPDPVFGDSGNGAHLCYRIDLPGNDNGVVERCLKGLAARFDDDRVNVDTSVFNPARIWKVYGSVARKGDAIPDRPRRLARLIDIPDRIEEAQP
jgi:hypothetical protein